MAKKAPTVKTAGALYTRYHPDYAQMRISLVPLSLTSGNAAIKGASHIHSSVGFTTPDLSLEGAVRLLILKHFIQG